MENLDELAAYWKAEGRSIWHEALAEQRSSTIQAAQKILTAIGPEGFDAGAAVKRLAAELDETEPVVEYALAVLLTQPGGRKFVDRDGRIYAAGP